MKNNIIKNYFHESLKELHSVTWPTRNQMFKITAIVLAFTFVAAAFIAGIDFLFNQAINLI